MSTGLRGWWHRRYADEIAAPAHQDHYRATLQLASADNSLYFSADIVLWAWWSVRDKIPESLWDIARSGITHRAEEVSTRYRLTAAERVRAELNTALASWRPVGQSQVHARGHCVSVGADPELMAAVAEHEQSLQQQVVMSWSEQRLQRQREQMCSLLLDPLQATAWWLLSNQDKAGDVLAVATTFQELQRILAPAKQSESAGKLVDELLATKDGAVKARAVHTLKKFLLSYERQDLADQLQVFDE
ncbi:hypothetical protein [Saccharomonospora azurea]|uniref:hypothetical protein n=1 Tax=Saccharomonospora azurea TaxID=40988 RepID=UPI00055A470F|nr:hypothetical protein [Saccharomonospora azurea]